MKLEFGASPRFAELKKMEISFSTTPIFKRKLKISFEKN